ncbi:MAG: response regulator [Candidatus Omnitrophica bacterium]|nr:response regulator [Candidatus Omnitrophota bacterium]
MAYKILLVDDDKEFRSLFKGCLESYEIIEASSGREALELLKKANDIDLVLLDVVMPGLSGTEALKEIRKIDPNLGVIIFTAYGSKDAAVEALRGHADDFIEKGVDITEAENTISRVLEVRKGGNRLFSSDINGKVERAKRFIERNCYKKVCLKDASEAVCLSPKYLSRVFKQHTGLGFSQYRLKIKIKEATSMLKNTGCSISQIADKLSYKNVESFIRQFKKITGSTPSVCRRSKLTKKKAARKNHR